MSGANAERGEQPLVLGGVAYKLRPSFDAIVAMEKATRRSLIELTNDASGGQLSLTEVGIVTAELIRAGAEDDLTRHVSAQQLAMLAFESGLPAVLPVLTLCLVGAVNGGRDRSGEVKAPVAAPETGAAAGAE